MERLLSVARGWLSIVRARAGMAGAAVAVLNALLLSGAARAGEQAYLHVFGFDAAGEIFAFEQFGVQDGSGFPYAEIFWVSTRTNRWAFSPVRVSLREPSDDEREARRVARSRATGSRDLALYSYSGRRVFSQAVDRWPATGPAEATFANPFEFPPRQPRYRVLLRDRTVPSQECARYTDQPVRALVVEQRRLPDGLAQVLQRDAGIPSSRGCPLGYKLAMIDLYRRTDGTVALVALVGLSRVGFEGPDLRYLAVSGSLAQDG